MNFLRRHGGLILAGLFVLLFCCGIAAAFWPVLPRDLVFVAPDAPVAPLTRGEAWRALFTQPVAPLHLLTGLIGYHWAYEATFWFASALMGLGMLGVLRANRMPWGPAAFGAFCAAFMGYFFTLFCAGHRGVVDTLALWSLSMAALAWTLRTGRLRWAVALGLSLVPGLALQPDIWLFGCAILAAYALWLVFRSPLPWRRLLVLMVTALGVFLFAAWLNGSFAQAFGAAKTTRDTQLTQATQDAPDPSTARAAHDRFVTNWSLPPEDCREFLLPGSIGYTSYPFDPEPYRGRMGAPGRPYRQHTVHLGILTVAFALFAPVVFWRRRRTDPCVSDLPFWIGCFAVTLVLAFGRFTPLYNMVLEVPLLRDIRAPVKWLHFAGFAAAAAAAIGASRLRPGVCLLLCLGVTVNMAWVARRYVFPMDLSWPELRILEGTAVYVAPDLRSYEPRLLWNGVRVTHDPEADVPLRFCRDRFGQPGFYRLER